MAEPERSNEPEPANSFRFNLPGLIVFSLCLVAGAIMTIASFAAVRRTER